MFSPRALVRGNPARAKFVTEKLLYAFIILVLKFVAEKVLLLLVISLTDLLGILL